MRFLLLAEHIGIISPCLLTSFCIFFCLCMLLCRLFLLAPQFPDSFHCLSVAVGGTEFFVTPPTLPQSLWPHAKQGLGSELLLPWVLFVTARKEKLSAVYLTSFKLSLFFQFYFLNIYIFNVWLFACVYVCEPCVYLVPMSEDVITPWHWGSEWYRCWELNQGPLQSIICS